MTGYESLKAVLDAALAQAAERELLGAINYAAGAVLAIRGRE